MKKNLTAEDIVWNYNKKACKIIIIFNFIRSISSPLETCIQSPLWGEARLLLTQKDSLKSNSLLFPTKRVWLGKKTKDEVRGVRGRETVYVEKEVREKKEFWVKNTK